MLDFYRNETKTIGLFIPTSPYNKEINMCLFTSIYITFNSYNSPYMNGVMSLVMWSNDVLVQLTVKMDD